MPFGKSNYSRSRSRPSVFEQRFLLQVNWQIIDVHLPIAVIGLFFWYILWSCGNGVDIWNTCDSEWNIIWMDEGWCTISKAEERCPFPYSFSVWISFKAFLHLTKTTLRLCIAMNIYLDGLLTLCIQTKLHNDGTTPSGILYLNCRSLPCLKLSFNLESDLMKSASFGRIEIDRTWSALSLE